MLYVVQWAYQSSRGGPWHRGQEVDLSAEEAEAIDLDSPGVLALASPTPIPAREAVEPGEGQRQVTAARNRAVVSAPGRKAKANG